MSTEPESKCPTCGRIFDSDNGLTFHHSSNHTNQFKDLFWYYVDKGTEDECWPWQGPTTGAGYGRLQYNGTIRYAHRISYELNHNETPDPQINHHCDNPICVNPNHLYRGTHSENLRDAWNRTSRESMEKGLRIGWENASEYSKQAWEDGKMINSEDSSAAKLTRDEAREIKYDVDRNRTLGSVAEEYGVTSGTIGHIWREVTWVDV